MVLFPLFPFVLWTGLLVSCASVCLRLAKFVPVLWTGRLVSYASVCLWLATWSWCFGLVFLSAALRFVSGLPAWCWCLRLLTCGFLFPIRGSFRACFSSRGSGVTRSFVTSLASRSSRRNAAGVLARMLSLGIEPDPLHVACTSTATNSKDFIFSPDPLGFITIVGLILIEFHLEVMVEGDILAPWKHSPGRGERSAFGELGDRRESIQ